jgi:general secretion pathway protein K
LRGRNGGFALVAVLLFVALLSLISVSILSHARFNSRVAVNLVDEARAEAAADAGTYLAIARLLDGAVGVAEVDGTPTRRMFGDIALTIWVQDEFGKVDLNTASEELLRSLFKSCNLAESDGRAFASRIIEWRTAVDGNRAAGAVARGQRFHLIDDIRRVTGMSESLFDCVRPSLTVYSGLNAVDPRLASRNLLLVLPDMTQENIKALLDQRDARGGPGASADHPATGDVISLLGHAVSIKSEAREDNGIRFARSAIVRITGNPANPFWVQVWRDD